MSADKIGKVCRRFDPAPVLVDRYWLLLTPGYTPPASMGEYALYLESRVRAFKELKNDPVRAQTESNRRSDGLGAAGGFYRCGLC